MPKVVTPRKSFVGSTMTTPRNAFRDALFVWSIFFFGALVVGGALYFLSFGVLGNVIIAVAIFALAGYAHYSLWGYKLSKKLQQEAYDERMRHERAKNAPEGAIQDLGRRI